MASVIGAWLRKRGLNFGKPGYPARRYDRNDRPTFYKMQELDETQTKTLIAGSLGEV